MPVVLHLLAELPGIRRGLVMVQAEVAERLAAAPGSRAYGVPSAKLAWYAAARRAGPVPRAVFWPVPGVDSGLLAFDRHDPPPGDRAAVFAVVDAAFAQRRKVLRSALAGWAGSPAAAEVVLRAAGVDPGARAETLTIADFARIAAARLAAAAAAVGRLRVAQRRARHARAAADAGVATARWSDSGRAPDVASVTWSTTPGIAAHGLRCGRCAWASS